MHMEDKLNDININKKRGSAYT